MSIFLYDLLFPKASLTGVQGVWLTDEERKAIAFHPSYEEGISGFPPVVDALVTAAQYHESPMLQRALLALKYKRIAALSEELGTLLSRACMAEERTGAVLCPVPLHWRRYCDRGFNQSALLAHCVSSQLDIPVRYLLKRTRDTGHQAWRKREERLVSMEGSFAVRRKSSLSSHVILIDDIVTTGATVHACAIALKAAGVERVDVWAVARG